MSKVIPYGKQNISEEDIQAVVNVLRSDYLTQGNVVPEFEKEIIKYTGASYAVAVNSATSALHIACLALDVKEGDLVWTTPITFVASANCAIYCGASVDFVDIDPKTFNMSVEALQAKLEDAEKTNRLPKVVIPVDLCGQSCDMERIHALGKKYGFKIIEDASHAIGGKYKGRPVGSGQYSDITIFSFHPVKIITTGEGGMALTNNAEIFARLQRLRSHGITRNVGEMTTLPDGPWFYQQLELGYNYRMTDVLAALGLSQMKKIDEFVKKRHEIAKLYDKLLADDAGFETPWRSDESYSAFHLYVVRVTPENSATHLAVFERLRANGILVNLHYIPVYRHPFYKVMGYKPEDFPIAETYYKQAISLPIYPGLTDKQVQVIVDVLKSPLNHQTIF